jgi:MFS transporter, DHA1 family, tetracycline resistance protein
VFYGFESLLGLFTLSRLGMLGQGNGILFVFVGLILVMVQVRFIGKWSRKWGERRLVSLALALLAAGLLLLALTPEQPHPFYVRQIVENELRDQRPSSAEAILGDIDVPLPEDTSRGVGGVLWVLVALVPLAVGSGLIRPSLNSLMTRRVPPADYGRVLGASAAFVSAANAVAPLIGAALFAAGGAALPFWVGGVMMAALLVVSLVVLRSDEMRGRV